LEEEEEEEEKKMNLRWMEAVLPLGIIAGMLCVMGNAQYYIHRAAHGRVISLFFFHYYPFFLLDLCVSDTRIVSA